ncbi:hypothetical protein [Paraflavitalea speifideaquila]|uniref:hypothetical protein n=1 Tax=Paraflavitalea speifideaquila TaxID=3076558 RepID=UPI0028E2C934|nr:hypothetical protein [Paraflavitalea speifideiaquila]
MRPTGLNSFDCTPRLPAAWNKMALRTIHAFGAVFDIEVLRAAGGMLEIIITKAGQSKNIPLKKALPSA